MRQLIVLLTAILLAACQPATQINTRSPVQVDVTGPYRLKHVPFTYPAAIGLFKRTMIVQFDADAMDVAANYLADTGKGKIAATVYVYPVTAIAPHIEPRYADETFCRNVFENAKKTALDAYDKPWVRETGSSTSRFGGDGFHLLFDAGRRLSVSDMPAVFSDADGPLTSELHLFCNVVSYDMVSTAGTVLPWHVKYRFTYQRDTDARELIDTFMKQVPQD